MADCKYGDPYCPCQDGDMCHYEGPNPMPAPRPHYCRVCEKPILSAELCEECAEGNDPFVQSKYSVGRA